MPTQITFTFQDMLLFVLWGLLVAIFLLLIMILIRAYKVVRSINKVVDRNAQHLDKTIEIVPNLAKNAETISDEIAHDIQAFRPTVDNIATTSQNVTSKLNENSGLVSGIGSFVHTVSIGKALYDKYFGNKVQTTMNDIKDAIQDVNITIRDFERNKEEQ